MSVNDHISKAEELFYRALREYLPSLPFVTHFEAEWLRNPGTGRRMHLDIAWPGIKTALEVQGTHHDRPIKRYGKMATTKQRVRDTHKLQVCQHHGWLLLHANIHRLTDERMKRLAIQVLDRAATYPDFKSLASIDRYTLSTRTLSPEIQQTGNRFASMGIKRDVRRPYRKPGLIPLLRRTWKRLSHRHARVR